MEALLRKELIVNKGLCRLIGICVFIILTSLGAFVRLPLPFTPVPVTLQTFFVLLSGAFMGNLGTLSQIIYVVLGISGLPIFAGYGSGFLYLLGPTGGYFLGFILANLFLTRFIRHSKNNLFLTLGIFCIADLLILSCGTLWLRFIFGFGLIKLLFIGFIPFLVGDLLKALAASLLYLKLKPRLKEIFF